MERFGRCIACGLCDRGEGARIARSGGAYRGLMELVLASSRSMPDFAAAARGSTLTIRADGSDERDAIAALAALVESGF